MKVRTIHTRSYWVKSLYFIAASSLLFFTVLILWISTKKIFSHQILLSIIVIMLIIHILVNFTFPLFYHPYRGSKVYQKKLSEKSIAVVIPFFNEDIKIIKKQIDSFRAQTFQNFHLYYVDDGSEHLEVYEYLLGLSKIDSKISVIRSAVNGGKRNAQCLIFPFVDSDFIFTTDSDTIFDSQNLFRLLQPFENEKILAVTGHVRVLNEQESWLTKLLSIRYFNAFEVERAGQSATGSILFCSGPNTLFRTATIKKHIDAYQTQMFLGKKQTYGDDRALTNFVLRDGMAVYQSTAQCYTDVPNNMKKFLKQQTRWNKSFFRESYLGMINAFKYRKIIPFIWITVELLLFPVFLLSLGYLVFLIVTAQFTLVDLCYVLIFTTINAYLRNLYYVDMNRRNFVFAPLYSVIHIFFLTPIRLWALLTIRDTGWGTRKNTQNKETV